MLVEPEVVAHFVLHIVYFVRSAHSVQIVHSAHSVQIVHSVFFSIFQDRIGLIGLSGGLRREAI